MTFLDRCLDLEQPAIPIHELFAILGEHRRGSLRGIPFWKAMAREPFNVTAQEEIDDIKDWLLKSDLTLVEDVLILGRVGIYTRRQVRARLGDPKDTPRLG